MKLQYPSTNRHFKVLLAGRVLEIAVLLNVSCGIDDTPTSEGTDSKVAGTDDSVATEESAVTDDEDPSSNTLICEIACSPGLQDCADSNEKCTPLACHSGCCTDATHCVPLTGMQKLGEPCTRDARTGRDDCDKTLFCHPDGKPTGSSGPGKCVQLCIAQQEEQSIENHCVELGHDASYRCINFNDGTFPVCFPHCDPLNPDCPEADEVCTMASNDFICSRESDLTEPKGRYGDPCDHELACEQGLDCADKSLLADCSANCEDAPLCGCCTAFCDLQADNPEELCQRSEETCVLAIDPPPPGKEHVGVCGAADEGERKHRGQRYTGKFSRKGAYGQ